MRSHCNRVGFLANMTDGLTRKSHVKFLRLTEGDACVDGGLEWYSYNPRDAKDFQEKTRNWEEAKKGSSTDLRRSIAFHGHHDFWLVSSRSAWRYTAVVFSHARGGTLLQCRPGIPIDRATVKKIFPKSGVKARLCGATKCKVQEVFQILCVCLMFILQTCALVQMVPVDSIDRESVSHGQIPVVLESYQTSMFYEGFINRTVSQDWEQVMLGLMEQCPGQGWFSRDIGRKMLYMLATTNQGKHSSF